MLIIRYSQGQSRYTTRPPTGVDLALGLGGYDKFGDSLEPKRTPSTLQPLKDEDEERRKRVATAEAEEVV